MDNMQIILTPNTIIGLAGFLTAVGVLIGGMIAIYKQIEKWNKYDDDIKAVKAEQIMQTKVLLATLDGLHQLGCNGKVTEATNELTSFLNNQAHN